MHVRGWCVTALPTRPQRAAYTTVLQDWLRISCHKTASATVVRAHMEAFTAISPQLLEFVINMADGNGNTALHYTVSHSNFPVVRLLLDTGVCSHARARVMTCTCVCGYYCVCCACSVCIL